ncbi:hypothetical protein [Aquimarina aquimarini]|uniref:hypothetical protein n=1 Tax=Aquimarina aquimarini TaxID=1191734 RepID=UPI000D54B622|nr:hypothetical protein [Aquimarina aquimarini]
MSDELSQSNQELSNTEDTATNQEAKQKFKGVLAEMEMMMSWQKSHQSNSDLAGLNEKQKDKLIESVLINEQNHFEFSKQKLEAEERVELKRIEATTVNQRTKRYVMLGGLFFIAILSILILMLQNEYFVSWLTFLTGILGGIGVSKSGILNNQDVKSNSFSSDENE